MAVSLLLFGKTAKEILADSFRELAEQKTVDKITVKDITENCGYVYDPAIGAPDNGIPAGTPFEELPDDWHCPRCKKGKDKFNKA